MLLCQPEIDLQRSSAVRWNVKRLCFGIRSGDATSNIWSVATKSTIGQMRAHRASPQRATVRTPGSYFECDVATMIIRGGLRADCRMRRR